MTSLDPTRLPGRTMSSVVMAPDGLPAVKVDSLPVAVGQRITFRFESVGLRWRQGVFLATDGRLVTGDTTSPALVLWSDSAPSVTAIEVAETVGRLVLYNVWDSGRGRDPFESQSATSGMLIESLPDGSLRYSCTDIGAEPDFGRVVFKVSIE